MAERFFRNLPVPHASPDCGMTTTAPRHKSNRAEPRASGPCVLIIFGITGDLTRRLLLPALYNLANHKLLPEEFAVVGFALSDISEQQFREKLEEDLRQTIGPDADVDLIHWLVSRVRLVASDFDSASGWEQLHQILAETDRDHGTGGNYLFYMATAPEFFLPLMRRVAQEKLFDDSGGHWRRAIIEKPFGTDLRSARQLNHELLEVVREN